MKKIIFSTMIASLLAFVGCQNEELVNENTNNGGEKVILTANIQGAADSRVALTYDENDEDYPVKVDWRNSGEKEFFQVVWASSNGFSAPTTFTQVEGSQFTGTIPSDITPRGFLATYGGTMDESGWDYNLSQQDGTLNEEYVLMEAKIEGATLPTTINFKHKTAILQPTFTGVGMGKIKQIVMSGVKNEISPNNNATGQITITPTDAQNGIYVFLTMPHDNNETYISNHTFTFTVTAGGKLYTGSLTIPTGMSIVAGNLYTATIALTEVNACYLPKGADFRDAVKTFLTSNASLTQIRFIAEPNWTPQDDTPIGESGAYMVANGATLEIRTNAEVFMFNETSSSMFSSFSSIGPRITSIDFNGCINTSNVTTLDYMFQNCRMLTSLDLSGFNTANVTSLQAMFASCAALQDIIFGNSFSTNKVTAMDYVFQNCSKLTSLDLTGFSFNDNLTTNEMFYYTGGNNPTANRIPIKVTETGYNFLKDKTDTKIQYSNAKYVQPNGADWPASE